MGKIITLIFFILSPSLWAYDPFAKVECRKRVSSSEFVYFEILPATLSGHKGHLEFFKNYELTYKQDFRMYLNTTNVLFSFESESANILFNIERQIVKSGDRFKGRYVSKVPSSPVQVVEFDCDYFFVEEE
jgi:hypothetical protein